MLGLVFQQARPGHLGSLHLADLEKAGADSDFEVADAVESDVDNFLPDEGDEVTIRSDSNLNGYVIPADLEVNWSGYAVSRGKPKPPDAKRSGGRWEHIEWNNKVRCVSCCCSNKPCDVLFDVGLDLLFEQFFHLCVRVCVCVCRVG